MDTAVVLGVPLHVEQREARDAAVVGRRRLQPVLQQLELVLVTSVLLLVRYKRILVQLRELLGQRRVLCTAGVQLERLLDGNLGIADTLQATQRDSLAEVPLRPGVVQSDAALSIGEGSAERLAANDRTPTSAPTPRAIQSTTSAGTYTWVIKGNVRRRTVREVRLVRRVGGDGL